MRELPIIFSGPMVIRLMTCKHCGKISVAPVCECGSTEFLKSQTRRIVRQQPPDGWSMQFPGVLSRAARHVNWAASGYDGDKRWGEPIFPPYAVGDHLCVREKQRVIARADAGTKIRVRYEADGSESDWLPYPSRLKGFPHVGKCLAYGGYKESARHWLEVTEVRVQRIQDTSEEDAIAEGFTCKDWNSKLHNPTWTAEEYARHVLSGYWDVLNAKRGNSWEQNDWVFVYSFKRIDHASR